MSKMNKLRDFKDSKINVIKNILRFLVLSAFFLLLYYAKSYDYNLFHIIIEFFSILIAVTMFILVWNTRNISDNSFILFLGIGYLYIATVDIFHAISYEGINIFTGFGTNLPMQLWIFARYIEALTLLLSLLCLKRIHRFKYWYLQLIYFIVTAGGLASIFYLKFFPDCFIEGSGPTLFKIISEYIIIVILASAMVLLYQRRNSIGRDMSGYLAVAIAATILSKFMFTLYNRDVYGILDALGHYFKIISYYSLYLAIVQSSLFKPYETLFLNLKDSKERFEKLVQMLPEIVIETNERGDILYTNKLGFELTGYTPEDFTKKRFNIFEMVADSDRQKMQRSVELLIEQGKNDPQEYRIKKKNGRTFVIITRSNVIRDDSGKFTGLRVVAIDLTEYKKTRIKMLENVKKYKTFFENSPISMWEEDFSEAIRYINKIREKRKNDIYKYMKDHPGKLKECIKKIRIKNVNKATLKLYEAKTKSELLKGLGFYLVEDTMDFFIKEIIALSEGKLFFEGETINRTVNGKIINIYLTLIVMPGFEKTMSRALISMLDLTSIRNAEKELIKSEKQYRSLFENSLDGIYKSTVDGKYIDANRSLVEMLGYESKEELLSVNTKHLYLSPEDRPDADKRNRYFETQLKKKDNTPIWVEISSRVIIDETEPIQYEGVVRDITERKKAEEEIKYLFFHDNLTGLYNKNYFNEELKRLDTPRQYPIALIFFDINGLKIINDTFGIERGDRIIKKISELSKKFFRADDILARWSGGEFAVIMTKTKEEEVENIIERLHKVFIENSSSTLPLSVAFGYSVKNEKNRSIKILIKIAEEKMHKHKLNVKDSTHSAIIDSLKKALEERDYETEEHTNRLVSITTKIGKALHFSESKLDELTLLAKLHDIGKIAIPDNIILKPAKLNKEEYEMIKKHPEIGYRIASSSRVLSPIADGILSHQERWDGTGYPHGLKGEEIPVIARIISVADAFDAMTNDRPYRKALSRKEAIKELKVYSGTQFDPEIVNIFLKIIGAS